MAKKLVCNAPHIELTLSVVRKKFNMCSGLFGEGEKTGDFLSLVGWLQVEEGLITCPLAVCIFSTCTYFLNLFWMDQYSTGISSHFANCAELKNGYQADWLAG